MPSKRSQTVLIILFIAALSSAGYYIYANYFASSTANTVLSASGTVEAADVIIAPELSGKIIEALVKEGDQVNAGDTLFRLDDTLLQAQRRVAVAAVETAKTAATTAEAAAATAQSQYDLTLAAALAEQKASRIEDWVLTVPAEFNQPGWYFEKSEQIASSQNEVASAQTALETSRNRLASVEEKSASGDFMAVESRLMDARSAFAVAKNVLDASASADQALKDSAQKNYDSATSELVDAQQAYDDAMTTTGGTDVLTARADLRVAQERYDTAQDILRLLQTGADSPKVAAAQQSLQQAQAVVTQARAAITQAEANLALLDAQIAKLTVTAPADAFVLTRALEPGEVVMPGAALLTLARLNDLTITVYIPEDRYGELSLGQPATVTVDSFPTETFNGVITYISSQAEFTPRNVQTTEGRKTTVFAIKLSLADSGGKLKPGMPADVLFE